MRTTRLWAMGASVALLAAGHAHAEPVRKVLEETQLPANAQWARVGVAQLAKGDAFPWHIHAGVEIVYVAEGEVILSVAGQPDQTKRAGESYQVARGIPHMARCASDGGAKLVSTWIIDKGQPLSAPAQAPAH